MKNPCRPFLDRARAEEPGFAQAAVWKNCVVVDLLDRVVAEDEPVVAALGGFCFEALEVAEEDVERLVRLAAHGAVALRS